MTGLAAAILILGKLSFAAVGLVVGWKLAREVRRHEGIGLHALALAAIAIGGIGLVTIPLGEGTGSLPIALGGEAMVRIAMILLCAFIAGTFRPSSGFAVAAAAALAGVLVGGLVWDVGAQPSMVDYDFARRSAQANQLSIALPFAWSAVESAILFRRSRRRLALGLAEPIVVQRFLLWVAATSGFVLICLLAVLAGEAKRAGSTALFDAAHAARGLLYVLVSVSIALGIFPSVAGARKTEAHEPTG